MPPANICEPKWAVDMCEVSSCGVDSGATTDADMLNPVGFSEKMNDDENAKFTRSKRHMHTIGLTSGQRQSVKGRGQAVKNVTALLLTWKKPPINLGCPPPR